jgi:hypothetical protein
MGLDRRTMSTGLAAMTLLLALGEAPTRGDEPPKTPTPLGYLCHRLSGPIRIDGKLDDDAWQPIPWTPAFVDIEGSIRPKPRFRTRVRMAWDDQFFYVAAELEEPHVWATLTKHDSVIFHDPDFEVFIDPDGDNHAYYEFEINALNTGWDLLLVKPYRDGGPAQNEWEIPGLKTAVAVDGTINDRGDTDRGWSVELAFPWSALAEHANRPCPPREGDIWRVNFSRVEWEWEPDGENGYRKVPNRKEDNWVWSPQGAIDMHRPERWGFVQFTNRPPGPAAVFQPDPAWPAREALMRVYHAQRAFQAKEKRWARTIDELGVADAAPGEPSLGRLTLEITPGGYRASVESRPPGGRAERWVVDQDSRLRPEPE